MSRTFAFLVLDEHPYGREMLRQLLVRGFAPSVMIEECSPVADEEREKFLERMSGFDIAPTFAAQLEGQTLERVRVPSHNDDACHAALDDAAPSLIVLGGTRILKPRIFEVAPDGCLNSHPGLLPEVRGSASVAWAIERDLPIGCTCHFIDAKIDQGAIVSRRELAVHRGDTYEKLCAETVSLAGILMAEAVEAWQAGALQSTAQGSGGETHRNMPPDAVLAVKQKLAAGDYSHFAGG